MTCILFCLASPLRPLIVVSAASIRHCIRWSSVNLLTCPSYASCKQDFSNSSNRRGMDELQRLLHVVVVYLCLMTFTVVSRQRKSSIPGSNCQTQCGNVSIPYPFGIGPGCYLYESFQIHCTPVVGNPYAPNIPQLLINGLYLEVTEISAANSTVLIKFPVVREGNGCLVENNAIINLRGSPFMFSYSQNKFTALGCNNMAMMIQDDLTVGGCFAICDENNNLRFLAKPGSFCTGNMCCQTTIPLFLDVFNATVRGAYYTKDDTDCRFAFLVEQNWLDPARFNMSYPEFKGLSFVPAVLDWAIDNKTVAVKYVFNREEVSYNSTFCDYTDDLPGARCSCRSGFQGNPYIPAGCEDIDECTMPEANICDMYRGKCVNTEGGYHCIEVPNSDQWQFNIADSGIGLGVGISVGFLILTITVTLLWKSLKKRKARQMREKYFRRNGGLLLKEQVSHGHMFLEKVKMFSAKELEKATDLYNTSRLLGQGGQGSVYKGMLTDGRLVAVKRCQIPDESKLRQFINEVAVLSQIKHRNVVKLLGCCLETDVPLLVYEFVPNGTLFQVLHNQTEEFPLTWELRLRIALEIAEALYYLHSAAPISIYHRDIKSTNILLDDKYRAKVSDFGTSRSITIDQTHLTTLVKGTVGYLDPEYFQSSKFTDKSDVYSFGVVLVELLTGEMPISCTRPEEERGLVAYFTVSMEGEEEEDLFRIVDDQVLKRGQKEEILRVARLAKRCLNLNGKERPAMKEVSIELQGIILSSQQQIHRREIKFC